MRCGAMVVIETGVLITIALAIVSSAVSVAATWYFAKRRYDKSSRPLTEIDLPLEQLKQDTTVRSMIYLTVFGMVCGMIVLVAIFAIFA